MELNLRGVLIIDDHPSSSEALQNVIAGVLETGARSNGIPVLYVKCASSLGEAVNFLLGRSLADRPGWIFLDLNLEAATSPNEVLKRTRVAALSDARIFIWSGAEYDEEKLAAAWKDGAAGWIPKGMSAADLEEAVRCALTMGFYMPTQGAAAPLDVVSVAKALTAEERRLAVLVGMDLDLQTIANSLTAGSLAEASSRVASLCSKIGVSSLRAAAERVRTLGLEQ